MLIHSNVSFSMQLLFFLSFPREQKESFLIRLLKTDVILHSVEDMISVAYGLLFFLYDRDLRFGMMDSIYEGNLPLLSHSSKTTGIKGNFFC